METLVACVGTTVVLGLLATLVSHLLHGIDARATRLRHIHALRAATAVLERDRHRERPPPSLDPSTWARRERSSGQVVLEMGESGGLRLQHRWRRRGERWRWERRWLSGEEEQSREGLVEAFVVELGPWEEPLRALYFEASIMQGGGGDVWIDISGRPSDEIVAVWLHHPHGTARPEWRAIEERVGPLVRVSPGPRHWGPPRAVVEVGSHPARVAVGPLGRPTAIGP